MTTGLLEDIDMVKYVVGYNMSGFLPDSDPYEANSIEGAVSSLMFNVECDLIEWSDYRIMKAVPETDTADKAYEKLVGMIEACIRRSMDINGEAGLVVGDYCYWIKKE